MGPAFTRKYGTGTGADIYVPLIKAGVQDFALGADYTAGIGDVKVSKDGAAAANIGTLPVAVAMGNTAYWKFVFSDAELQCKTLAVTVGDAATKAVEDQMFLIETFGHASAAYKADLSATGVKLAADGLDLVTADTPDGPASTLAEKIAQLWARFFGRVTRTATQIKTYDNAGVTVATTQSYTASGSNQDVGAAS